MPLPAPEINFNAATQAIVAAFYRLNPGTMPNGTVNQLVAEYYTQNGGPDPVIDPNTGESRAATNADRNKFFVRNLRDAAVLWPIKLGRRHASKATAETTADTQFVTDFQPPADS